MKRAWHNNILKGIGRRSATLVRVLALTVCGWMTTSMLQAQNFERMPDIEAEQYADYAVVQGDYQTLKNLRHYWSQEAQRLKSMRQLEFALTGGNEGVLKVTVPARLLFASNDTTLLNTSDGVLRPLLRLAKGTNPAATAQVIIAAYSDNNGSEAYLQRISGGRARAIHRWMARQGIGPTDLRSFGFGNKVPRTDNSSLAKRERNRRISFYFVPSKKMIRAAKKNGL